MERLFFSIVRAIMLVVAILAFLTLIGGSIYTYTLYLNSQDTNIEKSPYEEKLPRVQFETFKQIEEKRIKQEIEHITKIKTYVLKIITNGAEGHGYPDGKMPKGLLKGKDANEIAKYVANKLEGEKPINFGACAACHGQDWRGQWGNSPNLLELPIYNNLRQKVAKKNNTTLKVINSPNTSNSAFDKYINKLVTLFNQYASDVGQDGMGHNQLKEYILQIIGSYSQEEEKEYLSQLKSATEDLVQYGKMHINKINTNSIVLDWKNFITWFTDEFNKKLEEESQKVQKREAEINNLLREKEALALAAKVKLMIALQVLGIALILFVFITMILVLLRIEVNTRKDSINEK